MVFSSLLFLYAFFPLSLAAYYFSSGRKAQNTALLIFSLIFYTWGEPKYVLLLMFMSLTSWFCALKVAAARSQSDARKWVFVSAAIDISLIAFFKYSGLICSIFGTVPEFIRSIALPIGISFYTFQLLTYVIDVYRGEADAQESYWNVLLYASLFHQCIAGPIVRYKTIADELFVKQRSSEELLPGIRRFTAGLAKKTLLANPCGALADTLLLSSDAVADASLFAQNLSSLNATTVLGSWLGVLAFTLQIYLDFSAYSDMAIGMGKMLGLHYLENFDYPYISRSATEFWRRWHISLGTFFRDYVYIPLGGNRCSAPRVFFNLFTVWALTGLWHGANWNFVLWGLYYFVFLSLERMFLLKFFDKLKILPHIYTLIVVYFGWLIFRFTNISLGWAVFKNILFLNGNPFTDFATTTLLENNIFLLAIAVFACTPVTKNLALRIGARIMSGAADAKVLEIVRSCVIPVVLLLLSTCALVGDSYNPFIYFQF